MPTGLNCCQWKSKLRTCAGAGPPARLVAAHILSMVFPGWVCGSQRIWGDKSQRPCLSSLLPGWRGVVLTGGGGRSHLDHQNCGCSGHKGCNQVIWLIGGSGVTFNRNENFITRP